MKDKKPIYALVAVLIGVPGLYLLSEKVENPIYFYAAFGLAFIGIGWAIWSAIRK